MEKQKFISKKWFIILAIILLLIPVVAYAAPATATGTLSNVFDDVFKTFAGVLTQLLRLFQKLLWPIMLAIGGLLGNDLLFGAGMESRLLEVWTQIRNFVNIAFVVILLFVALYNVIGFGKQENFMLKAALPKIVIALILVNFSYVAMKVILDVTNVLTIAVFSLPTAIGEDLKNTEIIRKTDDGKYEVIDQALEKKICKSMYGATADFQTMIKNQGLNEEAQKKLHCEQSGSQLVFTEAGKKFFSQYTPRNASLILAIQLMNVADVDQITDAASKGFNLSTLSFTLLFSTAVYVLYAVAYAVLFIVLLVRLVVLWIFIALSPVVAVSLAFPDMLSKAGSDFDFKDKFVKHAIAPIMIAVPMTLGYIMLDALKNVNTRHLSNSFQLGTLDIHTAGISDLQTMIVAFGAVAVVWVGVFAAARGTYAEGIVEGIRSKLKQYGGTVVKAVKLLPLIPAGAGAKGRISFNQAAQLWQAPMRELERKYGGPQGETGPLTIYQVQNIRTAAEARAALGREGLENRAVQAELAKRIENLRRAPGGRALYREVTQAIGGKGRWGQFKGGGFRRGSRQLKELQRLSGRTTTAATAGRIGTGVAGAGAATAAANLTAKEREMQDTVSYGSATGLLDADAQTTYDNWKKEKAKKKPNKRKLKEYEDSLKNNESFKDAKAVQEKARTTTIDVTTASNKIVNSPTATNPTTAQIDELKKKIKVADDELRVKAEINDPDRRKKIIKKLVEKAFSGNPPANVKGLL